MELQLALSLIFSRTVSLNNPIKTHKCTRPKDVVGGFVSGDRQACPWDRRCLCESCCVHLDRAWTGPRSLTG